MQRIKAIITSIYYYAVKRETKKFMSWAEQHYITGNTFSKNNDEFQLPVMSRTKLRIDGCIVESCKSLFLTVIFLSDTLWGIGTDFCF